MKILFVLHQFFPLHVTGTEQYSRALALELRRRGHEVEVFAFEPLVQYAADGAMRFSRLDDVDGIPVHRFGLHPVSAPNRELAETENPLVAEAYDQVLAAGGYDLVHVFHARHVGRDAIRAPRRRGIPVAVNLMDFWFVCPNFLLLRRDHERQASVLCDGPPENGLGCITCLNPYLRQDLEAGGAIDELRALAEHAGPDLAAVQGSQQPSLARRGFALLGRRERMLSALAEADLILAPSRFLQAMFERNGLVSDRVHHLPYGLDPDRFGTVARAERAPDKEHLDVGYVGSLTEHKGVHVLLEAAALVDDPRLRITVHGDPRSQPGYSDRLIRSNSDPRVTFPGTFRPEDLGSVLRSLDLLVVPSLWYENTPFSVLEALWFGVPVLASDLGGITECILPGRTGHLFPHGDREALAAELRRALDEPTEYCRFDPVGRPPTIADNVDTLLGLYAAARQRTPA